MSAPSHQPNGSPTESLNRAARAAARCARLAWQLVRRATVPDSPKLDLARVLWDLSGHVGPGPDNGPYALTVIRPVENLLDAAAGRSPQSIEIGFPGLPRSSNYHRHAVRMAYQVFVAIEGSFRDQNALDSIRQWIRLAEDLRAGKFKYDEQSELFIDLNDYKEFKRRLYAAWTEAAVRGWDGGSPLRLRRSLGRDGSDQGPALVEFELDTIVVAIRRESADALVRSGSWGLVDQRNQGEIDATITAIAMVEQATGREAKAAGTVTKRKASGSAKPRMTQALVNAMVANRKIEQGKKYDELLKAVKEHRPGADKAAQIAWGRNNTARDLEVGRTLISNCPLWCEIADELGLRRRTRRSSTVRPKKTGLDVGMEKKAERASQSTLDVVEQNETIERIRKTLPIDDAEELIDRFVRGEVSDDNVEHILALFAEQRIDERTNKVPQRPF